MLYSLQAHSSLCDFLSFSLDSRLLISRTSFTLSTWDIQSGQELYTLRGNLKAFTACTFSSDGKTFIGSDEDGTITVWDLQTGQQLHSQQQEPGKPHLLAMHPDGQICVHSNSDGTNTAWELQTGKERRVFRNDDRVDKISELCFSSDGRLLISVTRDPIRYRNCIKGWNFHNGEKQFTYEETVSRFGALAISPNGQILSVSHASNGVKVLNLLTGEELAICEHDDEKIRFILFNPQGTRMITVSSETIKVWRVVF